jgi:hypothetical protein
MLAVGWDSRDSPNSYYRQLILILNREVGTVGWKFEK